MKKKEGPSRYPYRPIQKIHEHKKKLLRAMTALAETVIVARYSHECFFKMDLTRYMNYDYARLRFWP
jgi:hypothetical protein